MYTPRLSPLSSIALSAGLLASALTGVATAQTPAPGHRLFGPHSTKQIRLLDTNGQVLHTWLSNYFPGNSPYLAPDGTLYRAGKLPGGPGIGGEGGVIERLALDSTLLWEFKYDGPGFFSHHDIELLPNGNLLLIAWEDKTVAEAVAAGRDPALISGAVFRPDHIVEVEPVGSTGGNIVWEWHIWDHLIQDFDHTKANFGVVADHPELVDVNFPPMAPDNGDWNHCNSISYDVENDWILLNSPFQNEFWIIDHSTTTAEAAGHTGGNHGKGGDILYRYGNPQAYDRGMPIDQKLFFQHGSNFVPPGLPGAGNVVVFNNQFMPGASAVQEYVLPINGSGGFTPPAPGSAYGPAAPIWQYTDPAFFSVNVSNAVRLPNGNTLVDSGRQGWLFEVEQAGNKIWEFFNTVPAITAFIFRVDYTERTLWASTEEMSASSGGTVALDAIAGSKHAGDLYFMIGSISGTAPGLTVDGLNLPLNPDPYFFFTASHANSPVLPGFAGTLDGLGRASASLVLPPGAGGSIVGVTLNHA